MKILLINNNPVVSRLTALSARKEDIEIDEIQEVTELSSDKYDIVFVDADSWSKDVQDVISENIKVQKTVLFYAQDDKEETEAFDLTILKPFLPSEVSSVIRSVEESVSKVEETKSADVKHYEVLNDRKDETDELLTLDDIKEEVSLTSTEKSEELSLTSETLKSGDVTFDKKLEEAFPLRVNDFDDDLFKEVSVEKESTVADESLTKKDDDDLFKELSVEKESTVTDESLTKKDEDDLFELDLNDDKLSFEDELFSKDTFVATAAATAVGATVATAVAASKDEVLDFDFEKSDELSFDDKEEVKIETKTETDINTETEKEQKNNMENSEMTKILDKSEIDNIKEILEEDTSNNLELEDLMTTAVPVMSVTEGLEAKVEKKKSKKAKNATNIHSDVLLETLTSLPIESLRELLSGAKVSIKIKFPKTR